MSASDPSASDTMNYSVASNENEQSNPISKANKTSTNSQMSDEDKSSNVVVIHNETDEKIEEKKTVIEHEVYANETKDRSLIFTSANTHGNNEEMDTSAVRTRNPKEIELKLHN